MAKKPTRQEMLEARIHYGHQSKHWNPGFGRENIWIKYKKRHIINLDKTLRGLCLAGDEMAKLAEKGAKILFVGRKKQAKEFIRSGAETIGMPYIVEPWTGGILTNFENTKRRIKVLQGADKKDDTNEHLTKKELRIAAGKKRKLEKDMAGMVMLNRPPSALFVVDVRQEFTAVREAKRIGIPVFAILDSNASGKLIDFPVPGNDDSEKSIKLLTDYLFAKCAEGLEQYKAQKSRLGISSSSTFPTSKNEANQPKRKRIVKIATGSTKPVKTADAADNTTKTSPNPSAKSPSKTADTTVVDSTSKTSPNPSAKSPSKTADTTVIDSTSKTSPNPSAKSPSKTADTAVIDSTSKTSPKPSAKSPSKTADTAVIDSITKTSPEPSAKSPSKTADSAAEASTPKQEETTPSEKV